MPWTVEPGQGQGAKNQIMNVSTDSDAKPAPSRRRRGRRILARILTGALLVCCIGLLIRAYFVHDSEKLLADAEAEADRLDPGWRWEDLVAHRRVIPDEQNGAVIVMAAAKELPAEWPPRTKQESKEPLSELVEQLEPVVQLNDELLAELQAAVDAGTAAHTKLREIASRPSGRFAIELSNDFLSTKLPHMDACRGLGDLEYLAAALRAHQGSAKAAMEHCHIFLNVGRSLTDEPFLISVVHRTLCQKRVAQSLERILGQTEVSDGDLLTMQQQLVLELQEEVLLPALRGERVGMLRVYSSMGSGEFQSSDLRKEFDFHPFMRWTYVSWCARYGAAQAVAMMNEAVEIGKKPLVEQRTLWRDWADSVNMQMAEAKRSSPFNALGFVMLPAIDRIAESHFKYHALLECAVAAIAAERYRFAQRRWPASWNELVPKYLRVAPVDLFSDEVLRLRPLEDGMIIYSVGPDGVDNGGRIARGRDAPKKDIDVGFRLWNPVKRRQPPAKAEEKNP